jgi:hypothetical protein
MCQFYFDYRHKCVINIVMPHKEPGLPFQPSPDTAKRIGFAATLDLPGKYGFLTGGAEAATANSDHIKRTDRNSIFFVYRPETDRFEVPRQNNSVVANVLCAYNEQRESHPHQLSFFDTDGAFHDLATLQAFEAKTGVATFSMPGENGEAKQTTIATSAIHAIAPAMPAAEEQARVAAA